MRTLFLLTLFLVAPVYAAISIRVALDPNVARAPVSGRLVLYLQRSGTKVLDSGGTLTDYEYLFGMDVTNLQPGGTVVFDDHADGYPFKPSAFPPGSYLAQAVLRLHADDCNWRREPGNLYSEIEPFSAAEPIKLFKLTKAVQAIQHPATKEAEVFEIRSKLLSDFHHRDIFLRAGILFPHDFDAAKKYPAIYRIPGFGGDGISMVDHPENGLMKGTGGHELARSAFVIWLDPQCGNGHHLFANSDNNGPRGDALVHELIPALEAKYPLVSDARARIVQGHSSGGWASLWLALNYPETFGACFAISPDPVDFHCLELIDIYDMTNAYTDGQREFPGARTKGAKSVREENAIEQVLGPNNTSSQDWDAWQACWGRRDSSGHVASQYDPQTGAIDRAEAESWRRYDITDLLRRDPDRYAPIFRDRVRLVVGDRDTFFLNDAVAKLKAELDRHPSDGATGYIRILPAYDHMSVTKSPDVQAWPQEMLNDLKSLKQPASQR